LIKTPVKANVTGEFTPDADKVSAETGSDRVAGRILELLDDRGRVLARLEERNL